MTRRWMVASLLALLLVAVASAGCAPTRKPATLKPTIKPPAIGRAGVLRVALDLSYPPFGSTVKGVRVGLDVDVAAALAERLGLKLQIIDAKPEAAAKLLEQGSADVVLGGLSIEQAVAAGAAFAGQYADDAPCLFSSSGRVVTLDDLSDETIAVQQGSPAFWLLSTQLGRGSLMVVPSLREALQAAESGRADFSAGDGIVGAYLLRDFPKLRFAGQLAAATPVGVAVGLRSTELETAVRTALDDLAAEGVLESLRNKWAGDVPTLQGSVDASPSIEATPAR